MHGSFEKETTHRLLTEVVRYWLLSHYLVEGRLPEVATYFSYADGSAGFDWGDAPGRDGDRQMRPLRGKRVRITMEVEEWNP